MREKLRKAREEHNMTQEQVAEKIGITPIGYWQIENGKRVGKVATWDKLEDLFGINQRVLREIS